MCGIVGYLGEKQASEIIMDGLHRLEYRGYDSAGVAIIDGGSLTVRKEVGKLVTLDASLEREPIKGSTGIGHTRWATHGVPSETNSHPHLDCTGKIAVVHNGIIENFKALREQLIAEGHTFASDTDTEVVAHLIEKYYESDLADAVRNALNDVEGAYAIAVVVEGEPDLMVAARKASPLIVGLGDGEKFVASDVPAILRYTRRVYYLDDGQVAELARDRCRITDLDNNTIELEEHTIEWDISAAEKGGYPHFMLKEIHEQPEALRRGFQSRMDPEKGEVVLDELGLTDEQLCEINQVVLLGIGTAWHACLEGKYYIEALARVPTAVDDSSEFRYRDPIVDERTLIVPVTQSGETADTIAGLREGKNKGSRVVAIVNAVGSTIARESHGVIYQHAGPEIGVASTKAYTSQISLLFVLAVKMGRARGLVSETRARELLTELQSVPDKIDQVLESSEAVKECADKFVEYENYYFLGRGFNYPSAMEGALKLKEISYVHAEGYNAALMKHGPIALITNEFPSVCYATESDVYDKMITNIQEVKARDGLIISIATEGNEDIKQFSDFVLYVPRTSEIISPIVNIVPAQLYAYYVAVARGCDVDQPRNLAKSVTVE